MLDVDKGGLAALFLRLGDDVQRQRRLAAGLRSVDFHNAAARQTADAQRQVQRETAGGDGVHLHAVLLVMCCFCERPVFIVSKMNDPDNCSA